ncbi:MAG: NTP transferase domain-containing protein [Kineosporiaceae bacterium]
MSTGAGLAGVVLAAGAGTRLAPLTSLRPKALCPVGGRSLLDLALDRLEPVVGGGPGAVAVNAHHLAGQVLAHVADLGGRAGVNGEQGQALGTAGALGALRSWLDGRAALVTNADAYLPDGPALVGSLVEGWDGRRCRLLCGPVPPGGRADFEGADARTGGTPRPLRFLGVSLVPAGVAGSLPATPSGLYEVVWRAAAARDELEFCVADASAVFRDCGTPADYLAANLHAAEGRSVVGHGAVVEGRLTRSVVWDGAYVGPHEHLVDAVRAGDRATPVTVLASTDTLKSDMS